MVGFSKKELYRSVMGSEISHYGYDKVHLECFAFASICEIMFY